MKVKTNGSFNVYGWATKHKCLFFFSEDKDLKRATFEINEKNRKRQSSESDSREEETDYLLFGFSVELRALLY